MTFHSSSILNSVYWFCLSRNLKYFILFDLYLIPSSFNKAISQIFYNVILCIKLTAEPNVVIYLILASYYYKKVHQNLATSNIKYLWAHIANECEIINVVRTA